MAKIPDPHHAALRRLFEEHLLRTPDTGISNIQNWFSSLLQDAKGRGWWDATVAIDLWNEYQRQGIVAVAGPFPGIRFEFDVPEAAVTRRGRDILARTGASPHDPDRFIAAALAALGGDEPVVRRFVVEAVDAYNGGMFLSSAALLGFAAERVLRSLAADVHRALPEGSLRSQFQEKALKVAEGRRGDFLPRIGNVTDQIRRAIESGSLRLTTKLDADARSYLFGMFEVVTRLRDAVAHDEEPAVERNQVESNLLMLPTWFGHVRELREHVSKPRTG